MCVLGVMLIKFYNSAYTLKDIAVYLHLYSTNTI